MLYKKSKKVVAAGALVLVTSFGISSAADAFCKPSPSTTSPQGDPFAALCRMPGKICK